MKFINEFIEIMRTRRNCFEALLSDIKKPSEIEALLGEQLSLHWHELPEPKTVYSKEFAVDSSSASRTLENSLDLFIVRALMIGSDGSEYKDMKFEMVKGIRDPATSSTLERILRDMIEIEIVVENCEGLDGSIVLIDGNLYGRFTHLLKQLRLRGWEDLPIRLLDVMERVFDICEEREITLVGVSKTSKTRVLCSAMLFFNEHKLTDPDYLDTEILYRWKREETGYTTPLLLGEYAFLEEVKIMFDEPDSYRKRFFSGIPRELHEWSTEVINKVPMAPAIIMFHLIPSRNEQPMRIDVPANCLGLGDKIKWVSPFRFVDPSIVEPVVQQLLSDWGGLDVYNALLYVVDKEVRLENKIVDNVYRSVLGRELNFPIIYDRSTRRFFR